jgi:hypothetical protein
MVINYHYYRLFHLSTRYCRFAGTIDRHSTIVFDYILRPHTVIQETVLTCLLCLFDRQPSSPYSVTIASIPVLQSLGSTSRPTFALFKTTQTGVLHRPVLRPAALPATRFRSGEFRAATQSIGPFTPRLGYIPLWSLFAVGFTARKQKNLIYLADQFPRCSSSRPFREPRFRPSISQIFQIVGGFGRKGCTFFSLGISSITRKQILDPFWMGLL